MNLLFLVPFSHSFMAYPIQRWKKALTDQNLNFKISNSWPRTLSDFDVVFLTSAFCVAQRNKGNLIPGGVYNSNMDYARACIEYIRSAKAKVIFFDARDGAPSNFFPLLPFVDVFLKRQALKDRELYLTQAHAYYSPDWMDESPRREFPCAGREYLDRISVGWNIGLEPFGVLRKLEKILAWRGITLKQYANSVDSVRPYLTSFRGSFGGSRAKHRNAAMTQLMEMGRPDILLGRPVNRLQYISEMKRSKAIVSPFGFGEPCFRDYEAFMSGALLVKPNMSHLEVYPDIYRENQTYLPVRWDFSDLSEVLQRININEDRRRDVARTAQNVYLPFVKSPDFFVDHMQNIISRLHAHQCARTQ